MKLKRVGRFEKISVTFVSLIIIGLIIIPNSALSVSFGAYPKRNTITVQPGGNGQFEILFFSRSEKSPWFYLSVKDYPENFLITYPESFNLNSEFLNDEYILISGEYVKAKVVKIGVSVPYTAEAGEHTILLNALSSDEEGVGNFLNVKAEKTFLLKVNVVGESGKIKSVGGLEIESESEVYEEGLIENVTTEEETKGAEPEILTKGTKSAHPITGLLTFIFENKILLAGVCVMIAIFVIIVMYIKLK